MSRWSVRPTLALVLVLTGPIAFAQYSRPSLRAWYATRPPRQNIANSSHGVSCLRHCIVCFAPLSISARSHTFRYLCLQRRKACKIPLPNLQCERRLHSEPRLTSPNPSLDATTKGALRPNGFDVTLQIVSSVFRNLKYLLSLPQRDPCMHGFRNWCSPFHVPPGESIVAMFSVGHPPLD
jgi:hypothetical protein